MEENEHPITEDHIIRYLNGRLNDDDVRQKVEEWLSTPENRKSAQETFKAWELSLLASPTHKDSQEAFKQLQKHLPGEQKLAKQISMWWYAAAASVIIVLGSLLWINRTASTPETVLTSIESVEDVLVAPMEDGSQISIDQGSTITYNKEEIVNGSQRKVALKGQAFFEVDHQPDRPFIVSTSDAEITVLGTKFMVKTYDDAPTKVLVTEGKVRVNYLNTPEEIILTAEQETDLEVEENSNVVKPAVKPSDDNQLYWKTGVMTFRNASLAQVLETLSKEFDTPITTSNEEILDCTLTATFKKQSLETILEVIKTTHQLESSEENGTIVILGNGCN